MSAPPNPRVRPVQLSDAAAICDIYNPLVLGSAITFEETPLEPAAMAARITEKTARFPWFVEEHGGEVAGYAYAGAHRARAAYRWSVETSIFVRPSFHRRGVGRRLLSHLLEVLTELGYRNAFAGIGLPNPGSEGLHRALGFRLLGVYEDVGFKSDRWVDVAWYRLPLDAAAGTPVEPRAWPG